MQEKLIIYSDEFNWTLVARRIVTKKGSVNMGGTYDHTVGFFPTLDALTKYAVERQLRVHGLDDFVAARDELRSVLEDTIKKVNAHECKCGNTTRSCINNDESSSLTKQKRGRKKVA